jgi:Flp pilus assembly protein protease CpaA
MNRRDDRNRWLLTALLSGAAAAIVWYVFHGVYVNLTASENAVGQVDPTTQGGIYFGYAIMVGGTLTLAAIAAWSAYKYLRLLFGRDR